MQESVKAMLRAATSKCASNPAAGILSDGHTEKNKVRPAATKSAPVLRRKRALARQASSCSFCRGEQGREAGGLSVYLPRHVQLL